MVDRIRLLERRDVDELIILDIAATPNNRGPRFDEVKELCSNLFCPVTIGGGVRNVEDIRRLLAGGADKVAIGTAAIERPELIHEASVKFGAQAVVASVDVRGSKVHSRCGQQDAGLDPVDWARTVTELGAGEILLTSVDRDGMMNGYDLDLIRRVSEAVSIPVIAAGGCGVYSDMLAAMQAGAHACASGAMFLFRESTPKGAAKYLHEQGIATRL
jgi:cyclase